MKASKILLSFLSLMVISCHPFGGFTNEVIHEFDNPERSVKIIVFKRLAGATANNSVQVLITNPDHELNNTDGGNIFVADRIDSYNLSEAFTVKWISNDSIIINHPDSIRIFKSEDTYEDELMKLNILYNPG